MIRKIVIMLITTYCSCICILGSKPTLELAICEYISARANGDVKEISNMYDKESFKIKYPELFKQSTEDKAFKKALLLFEKDLLKEYKERGGLPPKISLERIDSEGPVSYVDLLIKWDLKAISKESSSVEQIESLIFVRNGNKWEITLDFKKVAEISRESWNRDYDAMLMKLEIPAKESCTDANIKDFISQFIRKSMLYGYGGVADFLPHELFIPNENKLKKYCLEQWVNKEWLPNFERPTFISHKNLSQAQISRHILPLGVYNMKTFLSGETLKELSKRKIEILAVTIFEPPPSKEISSEFDIGLWESIKDALYIRIFLIQTEEGLKFIGYYTPEVN